MKEVTSVKSFSFYASLAGTAMLFWLPSFYALYYFTKHVGDKDLSGKFYFIPIIAISIFGFGFMVVKNYLFYTPLIKIDKVNITFNNRRYHISDIQTLKLTGKCNFGFMIWQQSECAVMTFKDGTIKYIIDEMYTNTPELKTLLSSLCNSDLLHSETFDEKPADNHFYFFKGNAILNFPQLSLIMVSLFFIVVVITKPHISLVITFMIFFVPLFLLISRDLHYFGVSDTHLVIRNYNKFWKRKLYPLALIEEVTFETAYRRPNGLRVITKNYQQNLYFAASVSKREWLELKTVLEKSGIKVRNECVF